jgi:hypothetical protein
LADRICHVGEYSSNIVFKLAKTEFATSLEHVPDYILPDTPRILYNIAARFAAARDNGAS